ncbi:uncharacterized protein LOC135470722 [Liolophura sinensis]|uniref:uncharacterized protein LOC135470722 n=1 Tax=Liolophura sinensis TaxID=3198878 RepID=UPI00315971FC
MAKALNLICLLIVCWFSGLTKSQSSLTRLYNKNVVKAERMERPLQGWIGRTGIPHAGVRVTTDDGQLWLVHKTRDQGASDTVVTDARHMSSAWSVVETKYINGRRTVGDYVAAGGTRYNLLFDNCLNAANRMMDL